MRTGAGSLDEDAKYTLTLRTITDPGDGNTVTDYVVHWDDGTASTSLTAAEVAANPDVTHTYTDGPDSYTITVDLVDEDGAPVEGLDALLAVIRDLSRQIADAAG